MNTFFKTLDLKSGYTEFWKGWEAWFTYMIPHYHTQLSQNQHRERLAKIWIVIKRPILSDRHQRLRLAWWHGV
jgi:hypothetical protein